MPRDGAERAVMLALRYVSAAAETGDAACFDAAFDGAEAAFGPRDGALLVARAAALVRALRRDEAGGEADRDGADRDGALRFLPPACRFLSAGESRILRLLRSRLSGGRGADAEDASGLSAGASAALADLAAPVRSAGLPLLPAAAALPALPALPRTARGLDLQGTVEPRRGR